MTRTRSRIEDIRRVELIEAAHRVFLAHGLSGMTTARICAEAGMSPGILAYYFKGKDEVLSAMVRFNNRLLMEDVVRRLRQARTPWDRLEAIVEGNFPGPAFTRAVAGAWLSVCSAANTKPEYERLQRIFNRRLASNLASAAGSVLDPARLRAIGLLGAALMDGLWLRKAVSDDIGRDEAVSLVLESLSRQFSEEERATLQAGRIEQAA